MSDRLTKEQAAVIGVFTGIACGPFSDVHEKAEQLLGRPIFTHEFAGKAIWEQLKIAVRDEFFATCHSHALAADKPAEQPAEQCTMCNGKRLVNAFVGIPTGVKPPNLPMIPCPKCSPSVAYSQSYEQMLTKQFNAPAEQTAQPVKGVVLRNGEIVLTGICHLVTDGDQPLYTHPAPRDLSKEEIRAVRDRSRSTAEFARAIIEAARKP